MAWPRTGGHRSRLNSPRGKHPAQGRAAQHPGRCRSHRLPRRRRRVPRLGLLPRSGSQCQGCQRLGRQCCQRLRSQRSSGARDWPPSAARPCVEPATSHGVSAVGGMSLGPMSRKGPTAHGVSAVGGMSLGPMPRHALFGGRRWGLGPGPEGRPVRRLAWRFVRRYGGVRCGARTHCVH